MGLSTKMLRIYKNVWFVRKVLIKVHLLCLFKILKLLTICGVFVDFKFSETCFWFSLLIYNAMR